MTGSEPNPKLTAATELFRQARDGDPDALETLLQPYWDTLYRLAYRVTGHAEDAEDLAQEALVRILQRLPDFRGESDFGTWVYRIALNVCLTDRARRRKPTMDVHDLPLTDPSPGPEAKAVSGELHALARSEIERLRPAYREAVLLRHVADLSYEEMARVLEVSVNTARLRVSRGMNHLRKRMKPWKGGEARP